MRLHWILSVSHKIKKRFPWCVKISEWCYTRIRIEDFIIRGYYTLYTFFDICIQSEIFIKRVLSLSIRKHTIYYFLKDIPLTCRWCVFIFILKQFKTVGEREKGKVSHGVTNVLETQCQPCYNAHRFEDCKKDLDFLISCDYLNHVILQFHASYRT